MAIGIWEYFEKFPLDIQKENRISLNEGNTTIEEINISGQKFLIKREDLNPSKSFKDRSLAYQLSFYLDKKINEFVLSSSGNAGISLISFAIKYKKLHVHVFLSKNLSRNKLINLNSILKSNITIEEINFSEETYIFTKENINIYFSLKPKIHSIIFSNSNDIKHLRPSHDDIAIEGYKSLGYELSNINFDDLYVLCSSGNACLGIWEGLKINTPQKDITTHIIQIPEIHPISSAISNIEIGNNERSEVNCIVDRVANRKNQIIMHLKAQKAIGHIVFNNDIIKIRNILKTMKHEYSNFSSNTLASLAIAYKEYESKCIENKIPLVIFSGI